MAGFLITRDALKMKLQEVVGKTLGEVDINGVFKRAERYSKITGIAGDVVEESVIGYGANSDQAPDLCIDGVDIELKTTGIRRSKKKAGAYEAKEPMSITAVSVDKIVEEYFEDSNFWHKIAHMLLVYYEYASEGKVEALGYRDFPIRGYQFYDCQGKDREILEQDWTIVRDFIIGLQNEFSNPAEQYPRISHELRSRLMFIDTAPKWPNPPRFRFKRSFVTALWQRYVEKEALEDLPDTYNSFSDIDARCHQAAQQYVGQTVSALVEMLGIEGKIDNKAIAEKAIIKIFRSKAKKLNHIRLFHDIDLIAKSITVTVEGARTEDMKLFKIDFTEWMDQEQVFENSEIYSYFAEHQFLYVVFEEPSESAPLAENRLLGFKRMAFDEEFIQTRVRWLWERVRYLLSSGGLQDMPQCDKTGKMRINKNGVPSSAPNFPKSRENDVFVRGSGTDSRRKPETVQGIQMYAQYVWIKGGAMAGLLADVDYL